MSNFHISIIGGKYRGKKLNSADLKTTRSTKAILKGSLFDTLQFEIVDKNFIEVFGGAGSIGLEALSRGAKKAYFIEKDKKAFSTLIKNCELIDKINTKTIFDDSFTAYPKLISKLEEKNEQAFLYFDPPFDEREGMCDIYERVISLIENTPKKLALMIIVEHSSKVEMPESIANFSKSRAKKFGKSSLSYYL